MLPVHGTSEIPGKAFISYTAPLGSKAICGHWRHSSQHQLSWKWQSITIMTLILQKQAQIVAKL